MKHLLILCVLILLGLGVLAGIGSGTPPQEPAEDEPIQVYLLAGQSNMEGQGVVSMDHAEHYNGGKGNLAWSLEHSRSAEAMQHLRGTDGEWVVREDVKVWFKARSGLATGNLTVGFTGYGGRSHIGPELQFGHVVGNHHQPPVLLVKTAWGGKSLYEDFRPPSSGGEVGPYYTQMLAEIREALAGIEEVFPEREDHAYELAGFVWLQGWNDMCTEAAIPEYEQNLVNLITDVRAALKSPDLPVVIGELGNGGPEGSPNMLAIRKAQKRAATRLEKALYVETHDHARPAELSPNRTHGHHWFGNAESYFLIGDSLGKGMLELRSEESAD